MPGREIDPSRDRIDFATFCEQRQGELTRAIARRAARHDLDPDDIVQRTFVRAQQQYEQFATEDDLLAWCVTVAGNLIIDDTRTAYRKREQPHPHPDAETPRSLLPNAEDQAIDRADLDRVMAKLPKHYRTVLNLDAEGASYEEIAAAFGTTIAAAGMLLQRARRAARKAMGPLVAGIALCTTRVRRLYRAAPSLQAQAVMMSASMIAVVVFPSVGQPEQSTAVSGSRAVVTTALTAPHVRSTAKPHPTRAATSSGPSALMPTGHRDTTPPARALIPRIPHTCTSGVCVGPSCSSDSQAGDVVYLKADGPCGLSVTENRTPVCQYVVDNPVVGCQRQGKPQWTVDPPPPPSPQGAPL